MTVCGTLQFGTGPSIATQQLLGGFTVVDVADDEAAGPGPASWLKRASGPQEVHGFKPQPPPA